MNMMKDKFDIKLKISNMLEPYKISEKLKLSIEYYFEAKINMCKSKKLDIDYIVNTEKWIKNFKSKISNIKEKKDIKYTWINYDNKYKELVVGIGQETNIDNNAKYNSKINIKTNQYVYELFCILEEITNIDNNDFKNNEYYDIYRLICKNTAKLYLGTYPEIKEYNIYPKEYIYIDVITYGTKISIVQNYIDIINKILLNNIKFLNLLYSCEYNNIENEFNKQYYNLEINNKIIDNTYYKIYQYILYIEAENEYNNYIEYNKELSQILIMCLEKKYSSNNIVNTNKLKFDEDKKYILQRLCYYKLNGKKIVITQK